MFFSRLFSVPKPGGKIRPIIDLKALNKLLKVPKFRMETLDKIAKCLWEVLWATSVDITDAYWHVPIDPEFQIYFAFALGSRIFVFLVVPFGLSPAPWAFSRILKPVKARLRSQNVVVFSYLDDFLVLGSSPQRALSNMQKTVDLLVSLGFGINWGKSSVTPAQRVEFLGVVLDLQELTFSLPPDKVSKVLQWRKEVLQASTMSRRELEALVGFLNFVGSFIPLGRLYLLPIRLFSGNRTAIACLSRLGSLGAPLLWQLSKEILGFCLHS